MSLEWYEFEDVACNHLIICPLSSRTWTVEIQRDDPDGVKRESVIMTRADLLAMAGAILRELD